MMPIHNKTQRWVTIINRHYPPNPGITGESAWDLAQYLIEKHSIHVQIIHVARNDDGGGAIRKPIGKIISIPTLYKGKNKTLKSITGFLDGLVLTIATLFKRKGQVICMTSPPLLPLWASLFFRLFRVNWLFWSMDLFPEAFVANGKLKSSSFLYKIIRKLTYFNTPDLLIALGPKQAQHVCLNYQTPPPSIVLPCGVFHDYRQDSNRPEWRKNDGKLYFGYCGNLGAPHSAEFITEFITLLNPHIHQLVLAVYGPKADEVIRFAKGKQGVTILENVPRNQLYYIDVHLVSLLPQFNHTAVPSKAISSVCTGGSILFYGSEEADTWYMLQEASWLIHHSIDLSQQLSTFIDSITQEEINTKRKKAILLSQKLQETKLDAYEKIAAYVSQQRS